MKQPKTKEAAAQVKTKSTVWNAPKARAPDGGAILRQKTRQAGRAAAEKASQRSEQSAEQTSPEGQAAQRLADSMTGAAAGSMAAVGRTFRKLPHAKQQYQTAKTDLRQAKAQYIQVLSVLSCPVRIGAGFQTTLYIQIKSNTAQFTAHALRTATTAAAHHLRHKNAR